ncbi:Adenosine kinase 2 [Acorus calamus]|uniref:Adenosine kinase n=1 Tax=Acorus calamus TaxID=4465 RepID=A0AAV9C3D5_ACOCL|nr:Adenosine kinase 2 [Acorus calamus]
MESKAICITVVRLKSKGPLMDKRYDEMGAKYNVEYIAGGATQNSIKVAQIFMMNLSTPFICEFFRDALEKVLPYMDFVFGNETEARTFSKVHGWETENVEEIALKISEWPTVSARKRITVITQGADPVVVTEDGKIGWSTIERLARLSLDPARSDGWGAIRTVRAMDP